MQQKFNEKNRDLLINIDGQMIHRDEAGVSPFDSLVQGVLGLAVMVYLFLREMPDTMVSV